MQIKWVLVAFAYGQLEKAVFKMTQIFALEPLEA